MAAGLVWRHVRSRAPPPAEFFRCTWTAYANKVARGFTAGHTASYSLEDAKANCVQLGAACSAVTCKGNSTCTLHALGVTLFQHTFGGVSRTFPVGEYQTSDLKAHGARDNSASTIIVPDGFEAILFDSDGFEGPSYAYGPGRHRLDKRLGNDKLSSFKVISSGDMASAGLSEAPNGETTYMATAGCFGAEESGEFTEMSADACLRRAQDKVAGYWAYYEQTGKCRLFHKLIDHAKPHSRLEDRCDVELANGLKRCVGTNVYEVDADNYEGRDGAVAVHGESCFFGDRAYFTKGGARPQAFYIYDEGYEDSEHGGNPSARCELLSQKFSSRNKTTSEPEFPQAFGPKQCPLTGGDAAKRLVAARLPKGGVANAHGSQSQRWVSNFVNVMASSSRGASTGPQHLSEDDGRAWQSATSFNEELVFEFATPQSLNGIRLTRPRGGNTDSRSALRGGFVKDYVVRAGPTAAQQQVVKVGQLAADPLDTCIHDVVGTAPFTECRSQQIDFDVGQVRYVTLVILSAWATKHEYRDCKANGNNCDPLHKAHMIGLTEGVKIDLVEFSVLSGGVESTAGWSSRYFAWPKGFAAPTFVNEFRTAASEKKYWSMKLADEKSCIEQCQCDPYVAKCANYGGLCRRHSWDGDAKLCSLYRTPLTRGDVRSVSELPQLGLSSIPMLLNAAGVSAGERRTYHRSLPALQHVTMGSLLGADNAAPWKDLFDLSPSRPFDFISQHTTYTAFTNYSDSTVSNETHVLVSHMACVSLAPAGEREPPLPPSLSFFLPSPLQCVSSSAPFLSMSTLFFAPPAPHRVTTATPFPFPRSWPHRCLGKDRPVAVVLANCVRGALQQADDVAVRATLRSDRPSLLFVDGRLVTVGGGMEAGSADVPAGTVAELMVQMGQLYKVDIVYFSRSDDSPPASLGVLAQYEGAGGWTPWAPLTGLAMIDSRGTCQACPPNTFQARSAHHALVCRPHRALFCGAGEFLQANASMDAKCEPCPDGTEMPREKHQQRQCLPPSNPYAPEIAIAEKWKPFIRGHRNDSEPPKGCTLVPSNETKEPYVEVLTKFSFKCAGFAAAHYNSRTNASNFDNDMLLTFVYYYEEPSPSGLVLKTELPNVGTSSLSHAVALPRGSPLTMTFNVTDTLTGGVYQEKMSLNIQGVSNEQLDLLFDDLDALIEGAPVTVALQTLNTLTSAISVNLNDTAAAGKEEGRREAIMETVVAVLDKALDKLDGQQADAFAQTVDVVSGGPRRSSLTAAATDNAGYLLTKLGGTLKIGASKTNSFASAAHNVIGAVNGETSNTSFPADKKQATVVSVTASMEQVAVNLAQSGGGTITAASPDGGFSAAAAAVDPAGGSCNGVELSNGGYTFRVPSAWLPCGKVGASSRANTGVVKYSSLAYAHSPFQYTDNGPTGSIGSLAFFKQAASALPSSVAYKNEAQCVGIDIAQGGAVARDTNTHRVSKTSPLVFSFLRAEDAGKTLNLIVEPYAPDCDAHPLGTAESSSSNASASSRRDRRACAKKANETVISLKIAAYPASVDFKYENAATSNTFVHSRIAVAVRRKGEQRGDTVVDPSHVVQFTPAQEEGYPCRDSSAETLPAADNTNFFVLVETRSIAAVEVMVTAMSTKCQFLETNGTTWGSSGCSVSPLSDPGSLKCACDHLTSFGAEVTNSAVEPNLVKVRAITADDIGNNPVVFVPVILCWILYLVALVWAYRRSKTMSSVAKKRTPIFLQRRRDSSGLQDGSAPLHQYVMTATTGWLSGAGLDKGETMYIEFTTKSGETAEFDMSGGEHYTFARNTTSVMVIQTNVDLSELAHIRFKFPDSSADCYITYVAISGGSTKEIYDTNHDMQQYFWVNSRLRRPHGHVGDEYESDSFDALAPAEFNSFSKLFRIRAVKGISNGHTFGTVLYYPPQSRFTLMQRVAVAYLFLTGVFFSSAFFYQTDSEKTPQQVVFVAVVSCAIVTVVTTIVVLLFRTSGSRDTNVLVVNTDDSLKFWSGVLGWCVCTGLQIWGSYYVLLLSFEWGPAESWEWLGTITLSIILSIVIIDPLLIMLNAMFSASVFGANTDAEIAANKTGNAVPADTYKETRYQSTTNPLATMPEDSYVAETDQTLQKLDPTTTVGAAVNAFERCVPPRAPRSRLPLRRGTTVSDGSTSQIVSCSSDFGQPVPRLEYHGLLLAHAS